MGTSIAVGREYSHLRDARGEAKIKMFFEGVLRKRLGDDYLVIYAEELRERTLKYQAAYGADSVEYDQKRDSVIAYNLVRMLADCCHHWVATPYLRVGPLIVSGERFTSNFDHRLEGSLDYDYPGSKVDNIKDRIDLGNEELREVLKTDAGLITYSTLGFREGDKARETAREKLRDVEKRARKKIKKSDIYLDHDSTCLDIGILNDGIDLDPECGVMLSGPLKRTSLQLMYDPVKPNGVRAYAYFTDMSLGITDMRLIVKELFGMDYVQLSVSV